jgi:magnesium transporter
MPELEWRWGYFGVWMVIVVIISGMIICFRKKRWL